MDNTLLPFVYYIQIDETGAPVDGTFISAQNIFYIMESSWEFTFEDALAKGFAPVIDSMKTFTNGDSDIETLHGPLVKNEDGSYTQQWIEQKISNAEKRNRFIERSRNNLLFQSDWSMLPDNRLSDAKREEWSLYRQALRDIPANVNWDDIKCSADVPWPRLAGVPEPAPDEIVNPFLEK
jgi:hypothetical protein